jgi:hypothetical protein
MFILLLLLPLVGQALPTLHFIKPESNFTQITTLDACTTYLYSKDITGCNPALFPFLKDEGVRMGLTTITDGESVEVGQKLLFDPIKKEFLQKLFDERSFNSWGANSFIELRTEKFFLGYDPLSVNADIFVFNPSSPEVAMSLVKSNRLQLTVGTKILENDLMTASIGTKVYYYRTQFYQDSFFLSELSTAEIKDLIKFEKRSGVAADLGSFIKFENAYLPKVSFLIKNIGSVFHNDESDILIENQVRPLLVYENYSRLGLGYDFKTYLGAISGEINFPFDSFYQSLYTEYIAGSLSYALSRFNTQVSFSKYQQNFGFNFGSKIASIGIFYGLSRPLGDFSLQTESVGGIRAEISL